MRRRAAATVRKPALGYCFGHRASERRHATGEWRRHKKANRSRGAAAASLHPCSTRANPARTGTCCSCTQRELVDPLASTRRRRRRPFLPLTSRSCCGQRRRRRRRRSQRSGAGGGRGTGGKGSSKTFSAANACEAGSNQDSECEPSNLVSDRCLQTVSAADRQTVSE